LEHFLNVLLLQKQLNFGNCLFLVLFPFLLNKKLSKTCTEQTLQLHLDVLKLRVVVSMHKTFSSSLGVRITQLMRIRNNYHEKTSVLFKNLNESCAIVCHYVSHCSTPVKYLQGLMEPAQSLALTAL
jgi:hypothetical protein